MSLIEDLFVDSMLIGSYSRLGNLEAEAAYQSRRLSDMAADTALMREIAVRRDQEDRAYRQFRDMTDNTVASLVRWHLKIRELRAGTDTIGLQEAAALKVAILTFWRIQWSTG